MDLPSGPLGVVVVVPPGRVEDVEAENHPEEVKNLPLVPRSAVPVDAPAP